jgi:ribonuclease HII
MSRELETDLKGQGYKFIIGVDEAGRGCLAGPVVAAACILPDDFKVAHIKDSKKITTEKKRERVYEELVNAPGVVWAAVALDAPTVDRFNILKASLEAMRQAIEKVMTQVTYPDRTKFYACVDGNKIPPKLNILSESVVQGDSYCMNIAAASIIAKVTRDRIMNAYHVQYPEWNFIKHKGYGTASHRAMIAQQFPNLTPLHRYTFQPLKGLVEKEEKSDEK